MVPGESAVKHETGGEWYTECRIMGTSEHKRRVYGILKMLSKML